VRKRGGDYVAAHSNTKGKNDSLVVEKKEGSGHLIS